VVFEARWEVTDPLAGFRDKINNGDIAVLRFPANRDCPVKKGDEFELRSCSIVIESVNRKLPAGKPAEWHVQFVRLDVDRPQLLRRVPSGLPTPHDKHDGLSAIERARRESAYTSSPKQALVDEPESVGPDWKDPGAPERVKRLHEARHDMEQERIANNARAELGRVLKGLTPDQRIHLMAYIQKGCEMAKQGTLKDAA
jgi:hypothetical protein